MYDDYKIKPIHIMLPKTRAYEKRYDGQTKWMYFLIEGDVLLGKYNNLFGMKSALILKKVIANLPTIKSF